MVELNRLFCFLPGNEFGLKNLEDLFSGTVCTDHDDAEVFPALGERQRFSCRALLERRGDVQPDGNLLLRMKVFPKSFLPCFERLRENLIQGCFDFSQVLANTLRKRRMAQFPAGLDLLRRNPNSTDAFDLGLNHTRRKFSGGNSRNLLGSPIVNPNQLCHELGVPCAYARFNVFLPATLTFAQRAFAAAEILALAATLNLRLDGFADFLPVFNFAQRAF